MAKSTVSQWDTVAANNTDVGGINIAEGCPAANVNDAMREMMAQLKDDHTDARAVANGGTGATTAQGAIENLFTGTTYIKDSLLLVADPADTTKQVRIDAGNVTTATTRVLTMPDANLDLTGLATQAEGDILYRGSTAWQRLPKGTAGQVLRQNSGLTAPEWSSGWEVIGSAIRTASSVSSVDITDLGAYLRLRISGKLFAATDAVNVQVRTSTDNGSTFAAGSGDYVNQTIHSSGSTTTSGTISNAGGTGIYLASVNALGNAQHEALSFEIEVYDFNKSAYAFFDVRTFYIDSNGTVDRLTAGGTRSNASARNALRIIASSGNIASINYTVEGIRG